ncbi:hypothetical protein [Arsenicicoccus dermatophilus]|uniref:hypothetical protein n=1 Tax=Arsenicicoccus dermatophilus TaxID=1076331 RepID=UPI001F4C77BE|nr:hypothetical protein [Arsenicicoccus dermatophilus]MCH8612151.1 hypothetical protein [Arsenicicoccus dermatophilus]
MGQVQALENLWGRVPAGAGPPSNDEEMAFAVIDSWFAGVLSSHEAGSEALDELQRLILDPDTPLATSTLAEAARRICTGSTGPAVDKVAANAHRMPRP